MAHPGEPWSRCSVSIGLGIGSEIEGPPLLCKVVQTFAQQVDQDMVQGNKGVHGSGPGCAPGCLVGGGLLRPPLGP
eukprot:3819724-Lingulodinium_polyedra.AAC.1